MRLKATQNKYGNFSHTLVDEENNKIVKEIM